MNSSDGAEDTTNFSRKSNQTNIMVDGTFLPNSVYKRSNISDKEINNDNYCNNSNDDVNNNQTKNHTGFILADVVKKLLLSKKKDDREVPKYVQFLRNFLLEKGITFLHVIKKIYHKDLENNKELMEILQTSKDYFYLSIKEMNNLLQNQDEITYFSIFLMIISDKTTRRSFFPFLKHHSQIRSIMLEGVRIDITLISDLHRGLWTWKILGGSMSIGKAVKKILKEQEGREIKSLMNRKIFVQSINGHILKEIRERRLPRIPILYNCKMGNLSYVPSESYEHLFTSDSFSCMFLNANGLSEKKWKVIRSNYCKIYAITEFCKNNQNDIKFMENEKLYKTIYNDEGKWSALILHKSVISVKILTWRRCVAARLIIGDAQVIVLLIYRDKNTSMLLLMNWITEATTELNPFEEQLKILCGGDWNMFTQLVDDYFAKSASLAYIKPCQIEFNPMTQINNGLIRMTRVGPDITKYSSKKPYKEGFRDTRYYKLQNKNMVISAIDWVYTNFEGKLKAYKILDSDHLTLFMTIKIKDQCEVPVMQDLIPVIDRENAYNYFVMAKKSIQTPEDFVKIYQNAYRRFEKKIKRGKLAAFNDDKILKNMGTQIEIKSVSEELRKNFNQTIQIIEYFRFSSFSKEAFNKLKTIFQYNKNKRDGSIVNMIKLENDKIVYQPHKVAKIVINQLKESHGEIEKPKIRFEPLDPLDENEIEEIMQKISRGKAVAIDSFPDEFLWSYLGFKVRSFIPKFVKNESQKYPPNKKDLLVFNFIWTRPDLMKEIPQMFESKLIPLNKNHPYIAEKSKIRPIVVSSKLFVLAERRFTDKLNGWYLKNGDKCQIGFLPNMGTQSNIINIIEAMRKTIDQKCAGFIIFIDFKSAYNTIDQEILFQKIIDHEILTIKEQTI